MRTKVVLFLVFAITAFAFAFLMSAILNRQPDSTKMMVIFYGSALVFLTGLVFLIGYFLAYWRLRLLPGWQTIVAWSRISLIIALLATFSLILQAYRLLTGPSFLIVLFGLIMLELVLRRAQTTR